MMTSKRSSPDSEQSSSGGGEREGSSSAKRQKLVTFEPVKLGAVSSVADLDAVTAAFQNKKISERFQYKLKSEVNLKRRIEQLEKRQSQDDAMLCIINRYWNRLDEDVRLLLHRFDAETPVESESNRIFEKGRRAGGPFLPSCLTGITRRSRRTSPDEWSSPAEPRPSSSRHSIAFWRGTRESLNSSDHKTQHPRTHASCEDMLTSAETRTEEMQSKLEDALYEEEKALIRENKLDYRLAEVAGKLQAAQLLLAQSQDHKDARDQGNLAQVSKNKLEELQCNFEDQRELAANRLSELQDLKDQHSQALRDLEQMRMKLNHLPPEVILESTEYKCLQSQFTVLYQEATAIRKALEETRNQLYTTKTAHLKQIEQLEGEELLAQKQLRHEMIQLEEQLSQVRKEYEMLRLEFEQNLAANEQSGPVNREMRQLLASYKTQNQQLKAESARFKKKWKESISTIAKVQKELDYEKKTKESSLVIALPSMEGGVVEEVLESPDSHSEDGEIQDSLPDETDLDRLQRLLKYTH